MKRTLLTLLLALPLAASCKLTPDYSTLLPEGSPALLPLGPDDPVPDFSGQWEAREDIAVSLEKSLDWTRRPHARQFFPMAGISHERALRSLERFQELLRTVHGPERFQEAILSEFQIYKSAGWDGRGGGVLYTAYCTPILRGSLSESAVYRHPLYGLPPDLLKNSDGSVQGWETRAGLRPDYPSRGAIEASGMLDGSELVWLTDPLDAYIAHVNGSAFVRLEDGSLYRLGYSGKNGRKYVSLGRELEGDGKIPKGTVSLQTIRAWAASAGEAELQEYLNRNPSYVFFLPIDGNPHGSLDVEVTGGRSLATDKTLFPRGALVFIEGPAESPAPFNRFLFDQDTGGAIRTAGRADIYLGIGEDAEQTAGRVKTEGQLYYLFLRE